MGSNGSSSKRSSLWEDGEGFIQFVGQIFGLDRVPYIFTDSFVKRFDPIFSPIALSNASTSFIISGDAASSMVSEETDALAIGTHVSLV
jgi:hypothetical protein